MSNPSIKKLKKKTFLQAFVAVTLLLAVVRWIFPGVAAPKAAEADQNAPAVAEQTEKAENETKTAPMTAPQTAATKTNSSCYKKQ